MTRTEYKQAARNLYLFARQMSFGDEKVRYPAADKALAQENTQWTTRSMRMARKSKALHSYLAAALGGSNCAWCRGLPSSPAHSLPMAVQKRVGVKVFHAHCFE